MAGIARPRHTHSEVGVSDVAVVGPVPYQDGLRERLGYHVGAAIAGMVIDDNDFPGDAARVLVNGRDTIGEQVPRVVARDDYRQIEYRFHLYFLVARVLHNLGRSQSAIAE